MLTSDQVQKITTSLVARSLSHAIVTRVGRGPLMADILLYSSCQTVALLFVAHVVAPLVDDWKARRAATAFVFVAIPLVVGRMKLITERAS